MVAILTKEKKDDPVRKIMVRAMCEAVNLARKLEPDIGREPTEEEREVLRASEGILTECGYKYDELTQEWFLPTDA